MINNQIINTGNKIVDSIGTYEITGNIINNNWYNWILRENGKPHHLAISILAEIVYWYKPTEIRDEQTGRTLGYRKKFRDDLLQKSYEQLGDKFGEEKQTIKRALDCLEKVGVIKRVFRTITVNNTKLNNIMYIELLPDCLHKITFENNEIIQPAPINKFDNTLSSNLNGCSLQICKEALGRFDNTNTERNTDTSLKITTTTSESFVDESINNIFSDFKTKLTDFQIKKIIQEANGNISLCRNAVNFIKHYKGSIHNLPGLIISYIHNNGYNSIPCNNIQNDNCSQKNLRSNYNWDYMDWEVLHFHDEDQKLFENAEMLLGYSLSESQKSNRALIFQLVENKFKDNEKNFI